MTSQPATVTVIGAGLAGCEAAYQLSRHGLRVRLLDMKPGKRSPAHESGLFAELVCSNSLRSDRLQNAAGLLKEELRRMGSLILRAADATRVPAGGALAVDGEHFSKYITGCLREDPNIAIVEQEAIVLPDAPAIIATGPLTAGPLFSAIENSIAPGLHFYDAAAPVLYAETLDLGIAFRASRYGRGDDYLNCPMTKEQYDAFYRALVAAGTVALAEFENPRVFEGCMPVEIMAKRGEQTLLFGPLKPVGLTDERKGEEPSPERPHAVVQLRQFDAEGRLYNMVGFQTNLTFPEQRRVFRMIPGLAHAEFARYGVMHRNTFMRAPGVLGPAYEVLANPGVYFAGQITGVEGYVESAASGLVAGIALARALLGLPGIAFPASTATGALAHYVAGYAGNDFQPMNINFGIMTPLKARVKNKLQRYEKMSERALQEIEKIVAQIEADLPGGQ